MPVTSGGLATPVIFIKVGVIHCAKVDVPGLVSMTARLV